MKKVFLLYGIFLAVLAACSADEETAAKAERLFPPVPANLASSIPSPERNPLTKQGVALGRRLFYEPLLSASNTISCATCHLQELAFAEAISLSDKGESGKALIRHTPAIINLAWEKSFFWDGGSNDLESQVFGPLQSKDEMAQDLNELVKELQDTYPYPKLFKEAFGNDSITSSNIVRAIAQFERTMISGNSKYDHYVRKETGGDLTPGELRGLSLFRANCSSCHATDLFTDHDFHNNGIDRTFDDLSHEGAYLGRFRISGKPEDIGKFKTPTVRNVELTTPYMHDGRFKTLEEVVHHYSNGVKLSGTLDATLLRGGQPGLRFTDQEQEDLVSFLKTLTDQKFKQDEAFSNPFKK